LGKLQAFAYEKMKCPLMSTPLDAQGKVFTLLTQASGTEIGFRGGSRAPAARAAARGESM